MEVTVKLLSTFAKYRKDADNDHVSIKDGAVVRDLADQLGLPRKFVRIITVNGKQADLDTPLSDGDMIYFLPPAIGGG